MIHILTHKSLRKLDLRELKDHPTYPQVYQYGLNQDQYMLANFIAVEVEEDQYDIKKDRNKLPSKFHGRKLFTYVEILEILMIYAEEQINFDNYDLDLSENLTNLKTNDNNRN